MGEQDQLPLLFFNWRASVHAAWLAGLRSPIPRHISLALRRVRDSILSVQAIRKPPGLERLCAHRPLQNNRNISRGITLSKRSSTARLSAGCWLRRSISKRRVLICDPPLKRDAAASDGSPSARDSTHFRHRRRSLTRRRQRCQTR